MDIHELARHIARQLLDHLGKEQAVPCVMILAERDERIASRVRELLKEKVDLLFYGEHAGDRTPVRYLLPELSCSAMAELAMGAASGEMTAEILRLLLSGTSVEVLEFAYRAFRETAPDALFLLYQGYEKTLAGYGLKEFAFAQPDAVRFSGALVTAGDVNRARGQGASVLSVPPAAKITPLAFETARDLNITILKRS